ncbi:hypothetical protein LOCC1_G002120 [Lachnellula occidentalis]|uniref:DUF7053 domain-containing protein n=1 Tax=Lachnellula occidentalis TaxID=215460 RepID=A0A8H8UJF0_9HELO|nr:hypothetical protein LOCC1_G002120 [Lachnellula occidentalis]
MALPFASRLQLDSVTSRVLTAKPSTQPTHPPPTPPLLASVNAASALALLHNHPAFQNLQPLLVKNTIIPTPSTSWLVTEAQSLAQANNNASVEYRSVAVAVPMGPFTSTVVTTSAFVDTDDGLIIVFQAPLGLHGVNRFRVVSEGEGGGLVLSEEARLVGFRLMMPFVVKTELESHGEAGRAFGRKLVEMNGAGGKGEGEIAGK